MKFDIVWEDCIQEEARVANREALLKEDDQALEDNQASRRKVTRSIDLPRSFKGKEKLVRRNTTPNINVIIVTR